MRRFFWGVLAFAAAPLFAQQQLSGITLHESPGEVRKLLGEPLLVADINADFRAWQYRVGDLDHDEFSHALVFQKSTNSLVSFSRTFEKPTDVESLFSPSQSKFYRYPETGAIQMMVRVQRMPRHRLMLAFGSAKSGEPSSQIVLIDELVLRTFYPWLADRLK